MPNPGDNHSSGKVNFADRQHLSIIQEHEPYFIKGAGGSVFLIA